MSKYDITVNGRKYVVEVTPHQDNTQDGAYEVKVGAGVTQTATSTPIQAPPVQSRQEPAAASVATAVTAPTAPTAPVAPATPSTPNAHAAQAPKATAGGKAVTAPLPGVILQICVSEGQQVSQGQKLAILEAMKMENDIVADRAGVVTSIAVQRGDSVLEDATIMTIG